MKRHVVLSLFIKKRIFQKNRKKFEKPIDKGVLLCYNMQANKEKFRFHRAAR
jgi:hypothetical protein